MQDNIYVKNVCVGRQIDFLTAVLAGCQKLSYYITELCIWELLIWETLYISTIYVIRN